MPGAAGRILLLNQYYAPDMAATAQLLTDLGEHLAAAGRRVHVVASRGRYVPRQGRRPPRRERLRGVHVLRLPATDLGRGRAWRRLSDYATFFGLALGQLVRVRKDDTVVVLSTPPLLAVAALAASLRGARLVYKVEDLYPDLAQRLGVLRSRVGGWLLGRLSRRVLASADAVVALDEGMAHALRARGAPEERIHVIPNWADGRAIVPTPPAESALRTSLGLAPHTLVVGYSGNLGLAHHFEVLLEAAAKLDAQRADVHFLFTGDGPRRPQVAAAAATRANVTLLPYQPRERLGDTLAASDVHVVSLRSDVEGLLFPSKLAGVLAAGRPVLGLVDPAGAIGREIESNQIGWAVGDEVDRVGDALDAARAVDVRAALGRRCRAHFEARYSAASALAAWRALLDRDAGVSSAGP